MAGLFLGQTFPASAGLFGGGIKTPSPSSLASDLERRYNIDIESIQEQGQAFNVANTKKQVPEVSLFFTPSDPKPGEKISAKAFPIYFSSTESSMYYMWYLKHLGCDLTNSPSSTNRAACDRDNDGRITVEDWKIEAARILVQNGYDVTGANYSVDTDNDGYRARYGGDNKTNAPNHCYVNDTQSGKNYEFGEASDTTFRLTDGSECAEDKVVCMVGEGEVNPGTIASSTAGTGGGGDTFGVSDEDVCHVSGIPACSAGGGVTCNVGFARCVDDPKTTTDCGDALTSCSADSQADAAPYCEHLFPNATGHESGDGTFGADEEEFWGTDTADPDTADNGNKDESNVVGLGRSTFTWNYAAGDQIGVAVEGTSMIATKYADSSNMIMWALAKKDCPIPEGETGSFSKTIRGYIVNIPTVDMDLNDCLERNLVNPAQGGQATNLDVQVTATPDNPINDESEDKSGDLVVAQASISNSGRNLTDTVFEWEVQISNNQQFSPTIGSTAVVTDDLRNLGFLSNTTGNALDSVRLKLDIPDQAGITLGGRRLSDYLVGDSDVGYLRFSVKATESFSSGITRKGKSDVIVKFISTGRKISAYVVDTVAVGDETRPVLNEPLVDWLICNGSTNPDGTRDVLDRSLCRVIKNEIIGLRLDPSGLSSFNWTINGAPLICTETDVSPSCDDGEQNEVNFFPVSGNPGDTYTVTVTATDVDTDKTVTLSRTFNVIEPSVSIISEDPNTASPKFLGQYKDLTGSATGCPGGLCDDYSESVFQAQAGNTLSFRAKFLPSFLGNGANKQWFVDSIEVVENVPNVISFTADKPAPSIYNLSLAAQVVQSEDIRRALLDVWNISQLDSPEINFTAEAQIELTEAGLAEGPLQGPKKFFAAISSYIPASLLFSLRILLSGALILFVSGFFLALIPERRVLASSREREF